MAISESERMTTLFEDSLLADISELSDNEIEDFDMDHDDDDLDCVSHSHNRYVNILQKVESNVEYNLLVELLFEIENEIAILHNLIRDKYKPKFEALESLVLDPIEYARLVKNIGNETDLALVDMQGGTLPPRLRTIIMLVSSTTTTTRTALPDHVLQKVTHACDLALGLDSARNKVLAFLECKMGSIAPNLSAIVGSAVAAKLMGVSGGLSALANMPACNVQLLGYEKKKHLAGFSTTAATFRLGYLERAEIFQSIPHGLRERTGKLLAGKSTLAARVDATRGDPSGTTGKTFKEEIFNKIEKWQQPPPVRQVKSLPVPDFEPRKRRGGRRLRKTKERYAVTNMRKLANRVAFGTPEESSLGDGLGQGYGMLGQSMSNKLLLRVSSVPNNTKINAKIAKKKLKERQFTCGGATTAASGLISSLAFTPVKGIELCNPHALGLGSSSGTQSTYFGTSSKLKKI